jgi:hypothetical protein
VSEDETRDAVASLAGREAVSAENQDGESYDVAVVGVEGGIVSVLAPRMKVGAIDTLSLRFPHDGRIWVAAFGFGSAEYHSDALALVQLELRAVEEVAATNRAARTPQHALGKLRVIDAQHVLARNEYPVTVEDTSDTGLRFSCDFDIEVGDIFTITVNLADDMPRHVRAVAVAVEPAAFGRSLVRARVQAPG